MTNSPLRLHQTIDAMGSTFSVVLYGQASDEMLAAVNAAFDEVERLEDMLSHYRPHSEWSRINREAHKRPVEVSPELFELLAQCLEHSRRSEGAFDISVGSLVKTWGFHGGTGRLPADSEAASARSLVGYRNILLDPAASTVRFAHPGMEIDPGGIGKGYAVDRMAGVLRRMGFRTALLAAATSTIYGMGAPPGEPRGWRATIRDPEHPRKSVGEVFLEDMSLSVSGTSEKFFTADGRVYSHIMDPQSGRPLQAGQVAVVAPRNIDSEAWTKACLVNGRNWAAAHKLEGARVFFCDGSGPDGCDWLA